jgi:hypothetical protein
VGELAAGGRRPPDDLGDGSKGKPEDVVEHERHPLGGRELLQDDKQREADLVVEGGPVGRIHGPPGRGRNHRVDGGGVMDGLPAGAGRTDLIQADPAGDNDQPAAQIVDLLEISIRQTSEGLLSGVFSTGDVAQHRVGQVDQVGAVRSPRPFDRRATERVRRGLFLVQGSSSPRVRPATRTTPPTGM